jgi:hypothetical protein
MPLKLIATILLVSCGSLAISQNRQAVPPYKNYSGEGDVVLRQQGYLFG